MVTTVAANSTKLAQTTATVATTATVRLLFLTSVSAERAGWGKFAELMAYHVFRNVNGNVGFTIVNSDGQAYHIRNDHGRAGPGFDHAFATTTLLCFDNFVVQTVEYVRAFLQGTCHGLLLVLRLATGDDQFVGCLVDVARLLTFGHDTRA